VLEVGTPWQSHFGHGQRRKQFSQATQTSVRAGVATGSTKHQLRIPKKSEVRRTKSCLRIYKEIILQPNKLLH